MSREKFQQINLEGYFQPTRQDLDVISDSVDEFQDILNGYVEQGKGIKAQPGELMKVLHWDANLAAIGIFDFTNGQQVGLARAQYYPDPRLRQKGCAMYETELYVSSPYERRGLGILGRSYLRAFLADNVPLHLILASTVEAGPQNRDAAISIAEATGAHLEHWPQPNGSTADVWIDYVDPPHDEIPTSVFASDIQFLEKKPNSQLILPEVFKNIDGTVFFQYKPVARITEDRISLLPPLHQQMPPHERWEGVNGLWLAAKLNGYSPRLRFR